MIRQAETLDSERPRTQDAPVLDALTELLRRCASVEILPRQPPPASAGEFIEPWRGEVVTDADLAAERFLRRELREIRPLPVLGEESAKAHPEELRIIDSAASYWLVDPIDGSAAFAAGRPGFGLMVALVEDHRAQACAIYRPRLDSMATAVRGQGAHIDGELLLASHAPDTTWLGGPLYVGFFDADTQSRAEQLASSLNPVRSQMDYAACLEYPALAKGDKDFLIYGRLRPWDHLPGALLVEEAGGRVAHLHTGQPLDARMQFGPLLATHTASMWTTMQERLSKVFEFATPKRP